MSKKVECPSCIGTGQEVYKGKYPKKCSLCKGEKIVESELAEDFVASLNIIEIKDGEIFDTEY